LSDDQVRRMVLPSVT